jgi:hypothetical protein
VSCAFLLTQETSRRQLCRRCRYAVVSTGVSTAAIMFIIHLVNAIGQRIAKLIGGRAGTSSTASGAGRTGAKSSTAAGSDEWLSFFAVPVRLMWTALLLFFIAGVYFGVVFALKQATPDAKPGLGGDYEFTLPVGAGFGAIVAFWSLYVNMTEADPVLTMLPSSEAPKHK